MGRSYHIVLYGYRKYENARLVWTPVTNVYEKKLKGRGILIFQDRNRMLLIRKNKLLRYLGDNNSGVTCIAFLKDDR